ncbi:MAG: flagellar motor protein MotB [Rhodospirillaceae bacterium]|jgi:chemotaxis protein MotB|nr:flagellar motor protein MotB [Rhodospirillaceae bacterium]MBT4046265.1 flagellar motor protein MotB [Rhodospirillaceae bacterium]MBT4687046.1 flagellar motor protein MotB [Rhodospirillaceae bacterium]MBT5082562.1 flagellar motor protein MotB [Rhodospirillaceae bacterium]MBT5526108.1 flagellar motor protein MotB [Rhodospirillaceae bacterium]
MSNGQGTIVIKKIVKGGGGHHGGAWKVAYADFVTAMMAFFLLLWLLNVTTDEQRHGIADYFAPSAASKSTSGSGGLMGGTSMSVEGARVGQNSPPTVVMEMTPPRQRKPAAEDEADREGEAGQESGELEEEELLQQMAEREQEEFDKAEEALREAMNDSPGLADMAQNLIIDNTPEGMRIQLVDAENTSMFPSGGSKMQENLKKILETVADIIHRMPNQIAISGHTDSVPFRGRNGYSNWELSAERANASRRALVDFGVPISRIATVSGKAATEPLVPEDPTLPTNRRISIVLLREAAITPSAPPGPIDN